MDEVAKQPRELKPGGDDGHLGAMTSAAQVAIVKDHVYGRHQASHRDCPVCAQRQEPEWVRRAAERRLPVKATT